ncbi:hypothetical protein LTR41_006224 [Exophiala xenobiotica]|nr:hypothetical protein LTR41_006224 [Exophiala xenobiotica]KAK5328333.1 hypothetical protein LTR93_002118 [Exophiala xenobiotica]
MTIEDLDSEGEEFDTDDSEDTSWSTSEGSTPWGQKIFPTHARVSTCSPSDNLGQPPTSPKLVASFKDMLIAESFVLTTSLEQDWALLEPEMAPSSLINRFRYEGKDLDITDISNINENCRPLLLNQKYPEPLTVDCSEAASLIPSAGGESAMVIAHKVYHSARPGESGSWIVDGQSGNLLGILVSSSVDDECSYMLPSWAVFDSIDQPRENYFGSGFPVVTLPSRGHLSSAHTARELLMQALEDQKWAVVKPLLRDMDLTAIIMTDNVFERSPLEIASQYGNESTVQALLEAGFAASQSALTTACLGGHDKVVEILLEAGANPTVDRDDLSVASSAGFEKVVQLLLQSGAAASRRALELACTKGHDKVVKLLLEAGANPGNREMFEEACHRGYDEVVKILLEAGASPDDRYAFEEACRGGHERVVKILPEAGAKLHPGCLLDASEAGNERVVKLLLEAGANPDDQSAFQEACSGGHERVVKILLEAGAKPSDWCLQFASIAGHERVIQLLLPYINAMASLEVKHAFYIAVEHGHEGIVALFLQADVDIDARAVGALCMALQMALRRDYLNIVKLLIDAGADVREARHNLIADASADLEQMDRLLFAAGYQSGGQDDEAPITIGQRRLARISDANHLLEGQGSGKATNAGVFPMSDKNSAPIGGVVEPSAGGVVKAGRGFAEVAPGVKAKKQKGRSDKGNPLGL